MLVLNKSIHNASGTSGRCMIHFLCAWCSHAISVYQSNQKGGPPLGQYL